MLIENQAVVDAADDWQRTALHCATSSGHWPIAKLLLDHGAKIDCTDNLQRTPLHYASANGNVNTVLLLL